MQSFIFFSYLITITPIGLSQHYLAKHKTNSRWYWRNSPKLSDFGFQLARNLFAEYTVLSAKLFFSSDRKIKLISMVIRAPLIRLKTLFESLDDKVDSIPHQKILTLGNATLGPTMSPFLKCLLVEDDFHFFNQLIIKTLLSEAEIFSLCNLIANKLWLEATLTLRYEQESNPAIKADLRQQIAQENIEITGIYFAFVTHIVKKDKRILKKDTALTYNLLKTVYPKACLVGELDQIKHDSVECRHDLRQESVIGKISPNYFLAQLEKEGILGDAMHALHILPDRPVTLFEMPESVQKLFLKIKKEFSKQASKMGVTIGMTFNLAWEYQYRIGFYTRKPRSWRNSSVPATTLPHNQGTPHE
jgi:hypothetical protein